MATEENVAHRVAAARALVRDAVAGLAAALYEEALSGCDGTPEQCRIHAYTVSEGTLWETLQNELATARKALMTRRTG